MIHQTKIKFYSEYCSNVGYFFTWCPHLTNTNIIYGPFSCREQFAKNFNDISKNNYIGFTTHKKDNDLLERLENFISNIEFCLDIKDKTIFYAVEHPKRPKTKVDHIVLMKVSKWWLESKMRASLFTLFVRCAGIYYHGFDFNNSIDAYLLTQKTKQSILYFLNGNTVYIGPENNIDYQGWCHKFHNKSIKVVKKLLTTDLLNKI